MQGLSCKQGPQASISVIPELHHKTGRQMHRLCNIAESLIERRSVTKCRHIDWNPFSSPGSVAPDADGHRHQGCDRKQDIGNSIDQDDAEDDH
jgi:hypothetical protein